MASDVTVNLCDAILRSDVRQIHELIDQDPGLLSEPVDPICATAIHYAAEYGKDVCINAMIDMGADINGTNGGRTPLHYAVLSAPTSTIRLLLSRGADPNARSGDGDTPMLIAARSRSLDDEDHEHVVPDILEQHGAVLDVHSAAALGRLEAVRAILGANERAVEESPRSSEILLDLNLTSGHSQELLRILLEHGADPNGGRQNGRSVLRDAVSSVPCEKAIISTLLEYGASPIICMNGESVRIADIARRNGQPEDVVNLLAQAEE